MMLQLLCFAALPCMQIEPADTPAHNMEAFSTDLKY